MPNELFGTPSGFRAYDEDQRQLADLAGTTMLRAGQAEHQKSLSALNQAQAFGINRKAELDAAKQALRQKAMGGMAGDGASGAADPQDFFARALTAADVLARGGDLKGAKEFVDMATLGQQRLAASGASQASEQLRKVRTAMEQNAFIQDRLAAVANATDYATARMHIMASPIMQGVDLTDMPAQYDPRFVRAAVAGSKAANDQLKLKMDQADLARKQTDSGVKNKIAQANYDLNERKTAAYESRIESLNKAGGLANASKEKPVGVASKAELTAAMTELKASGLAAGDKTEFGFQAQQIADEAKYIQSRNKSLSASEARAQAIKEALDRGDIKQDTVFLGMGNANKFTPSQGSYAKPLALPATQEALQPGRYYRMGDGSIKKYEGPTAPSRALPAPPANNPLSEDDEE